MHWSHSCIARNGFKKLKLEYQSTFVFINNSHNHYDMDSDRTNAENLEAIAMIISAGN